MGNGIIKLFKTPLLYIGEKKTFIKFNGSLLNFDQPKSYEYLHTG